MAETDVNELEFTDMMILMGFRIEALENLLFQKGIIDKKEFGEEVIRISQRGEIQETKEKIKRYIDKYY